MFARLKLSAIFGFILPKQCTGRGHNEMLFLSFLNTGSSTTHAVCYCFNLVPISFDLRAYYRVKAY